MDVEGTDPRVRVGRSGEETAEAWLRQKGYRLLRRRFRIRNGEIDLVMQEGRTIVFVEVRRRRSGCLGDPLESVGPLKQARLVRAARVFLAAAGLHDRPCRFDVIVLRDGAPPATAIEHRTDAFRAD
jgi:putative endonuclease